MNYLAKTKKPDQEPSNPLDDIFNTIDRSATEIRYTFEQYKLYVQMADKVSTRRATTNSFFLTANSFLFVAMGALFGNSQLFIFVPIILIVGIFFSISWVQLIKHYKVHIFAFVFVFFWKSCLNIYNLCSSVQSVSHFLPS